MNPIEAAVSPRVGRKGCVGLFVLGLIFCFCLLLGTCTSKVEVANVKSPDGKLIARTFEINAGTTTEFAYEVDISRDWPIRWDHAAAGLYGAARNECAYGVNVRWIDSNTLAINYKEAKSIDIDRAVHLVGRTVRIIAKGGVIDPKAPCGGMANS
uniref:hypothetical protein n=1 Tax=uncultured Sphingomonas sp. TaxID=158754 RepID=UPI0035CADCD0